MTIVLALLVLLLSVGFVLLIAGAIAVVMLDGDAGESAVDADTWVSAATGGRTGVATGVATGAAR